MVLGCLGLETGEQILVDTNSSGQKKCSVCIITLTITNHKIFPLLVHIVSIIFFIYSYPNPLVKLGYWVSDAYKVIWSTEPFNDIMGTGEVKSTTTSKVGNRAGSEGVSEQSLTRSWTKIKETVLLFILLSLLAYHPHSFFCMLDGAK
jgi:hypothetical protein